jgi:hypothetical protein
MFTEIKYTKRALQKRFTIFRALNLEATQARSPQGGGEATKVQSLFQSMFTGHTAFRYL